MNARHGVVNRQAPVETTPVCNNFGVLIRVAQDVVFQWFYKCIFIALIRIPCNSILALLAITLFAEIACHATSVEWILFDFEQTKFIFLPCVPRLTHKRAILTEVSESGSNETYAVMKRSLLPEVRLVILLSGLDIGFLERSKTKTGIRC